MSRSILERLFNFMTATPYNQKRKKAAFDEWVCQWHHERLNLARVPELLDRNRESKKMHEEAFVVYQYLKRFYKNRDIFVELREGNQNFDAIIYDESDKFLEYVEVTCVPQEDDHLRRKELANKGQYPLETILTHHPTLDHFATLVRDGIDKKLQKKYPASTTLLVALSAEMIVEDKDRFKYVVSRLKPVVTPGIFSKIVILDEPGVNYHTIKLIE